MLHLQGRLRARLLAGALLAIAACQPPPDTDLQPDPLLQAELGLSTSDRVSSVQITGGEVERADPQLLSVETGTYVEFITTDWLIHEVIFETDSLSAEQRSFLERTDQVASPPLIERDSRYVLTFEGAPPGRYRYRLEGNGRPGSGTIVVSAQGPG